MVWTMLLSYPLMSAIQLVSARIGRGTGSGLAVNIKENPLTAVALTTAVAWIFGATR